ncbi:lipoprotein [uncultured Cocleimonas sp.]|uniref:LPS translocon maturation chaperone LptM n=1 Tax=uncultured Cocleimonas sp. TaxID=1051587 RepID=UPI0026070FFB|nr:lipoprotein [uncultured Cocleimonas sp.]
MFKNICWAQKLFALMIVALFIVTISGCGNKGDLYLPDAKSSASKSNTTDTVKPPKKH